MKIAFVTPAYYPAIIGASLYSTELAENLHERGHEVKIFTPLMPGLKKSEVINGISVNRPDKIQVTESFYISGKMVQEILKEKFDVIHSHHYGYFPATAGLIAAKLSKTPHVFGPYYHPPVYGIKRMILFSLYHMTQGLPILKMSEKILPHTNYEKKMLMKIGARSKNIELLPNIVNTNDYTIGKNKEKIVLFVSNLIREKGAHVALEIAERIGKQRKDVKFVFIGHMHDKSLIPKINELSKRGNVKFFSGLSKKELIKWYQKSLIFILPSKYEAFARVIAEAQSCGCSVVATHVGGIPEVVEDGNTGYLVKYGDWNGMELRINELLDNPVKAKKLGKKGSERVKRKFDTQKIVDKLESIYESVSR